MNYIARKAAFYVFDALRGFPLDRHLKVLQNTNCSQIKIDALNEIRRTRLLRYAVNTVPFYFKYKDFNNIQDFPIIRKNDLKEHYDQFFSTEFAKQDLIKTETSGSTGNPFVYYMTPDKHKRRLAEVLFYNQFAGYELGMPFAQVRTNTFSKLYTFMMNSEIINPTVVNQEWLENQRRMLIDKKIEFLIGWPSTLTQIASWCQDEGDTPKDFSLKGIVASAEPMTQGIRDILSVFGVPVYDRYATQELGIVAHQCKNCDRFHVNLASHHVELLSLMDDSPAAPGEPGRLVITDLNSFAMPLIRYEIGDIAILDEEQSISACVYKIRKIQGRVNDLIYNPKGENVNWAAIQDIVEKDSSLAGSIKQYQFIQNSENSYRLKVIPASHFKLELNVTTKLNQLLGDNAQVKVELVDTIPALPSGKCPTILNMNQRKKAVTCVVNA